MYPKARYLQFGDKALIVEFGNAISPEINQKVHTLHEAVSNAQLAGVGECLPTYRSLLITYDPFKINYEDLISRVKGIEKTLDRYVSTCKVRKAVIPVVYGGEFGPDLPQVAQHHGLIKSEVIRLHSEREYMVYMIGFIAGFPYLGELADQIATPRLETPRTRVPQGSVGIAEKQTGIYPREAPGGWQIIGRTPVKLFDLTWQSPALLKPGDRVCFKPVSVAEFEQILVAVSRGDYDVFAEE